MHIQETNIKNRICNYHFDNLKIETNNILID